MTTDKPTTTTGLEQITISTMDGSQLTEDDYLTSKYKNGIAEHITRWRVGDILDEIRHERSSDFERYKWIEFIERHGSVVSPPEILIGLLEKCEKYKNAAARAQTKGLTERAVENYRRGDWVNEAVWRGLLQLEHKVEWPGFPIQYDKKVGRPLDSVLGLRDRICHEENLQKAVEAFGHNARFRKGEYPTGEKFRHVNLGGALGPFTIEELGKKAIKTADGYWWEGEIKYDLRDSTVAVLIPWSKKGSQKLDGGTDRPVAIYSDKELPPKTIGSSIKELAEAVKENLSHYGIGL